MNASYRVSDLVKFFASSLGNNAANDLFFYWLEEYYRMVRELDWAWNWTESGHLTEAPVLEGGGVTFTWTEGNSYVVASAPIAVMTYVHTGRKVKLGDEWYRTTDVAFTNAQRIYVDRPILGSQATATTIELVRDDITFPTSKFRWIKMDGKKLTHASEAFLNMHFYGRLDRDAGTPSCYIDLLKNPIPAPVYPPLVTVSAGPVVFDDGEYEYFYTYFDRESGMESPPGPITKYVSSGGAFQPYVKYGNPVGDLSDNTSYSLRLYRSQKNPNRNRPPMFLIQTRSPLVPGTPFKDPNVGTLFAPPYYDGARSTIRFYPPPDSTRHSVVAEFVNCWGGRMYEDSNLDLGRNDEILELLRIFLKGVLSNRESSTAQEQRQATAQFRAQLAYLLTKSRPPGDDDSGPENYNTLTPGPSLNEAGDWVDALTSPWEE